MIFKTYKSLTGLYSIVGTNYNCGKIDAVIVNINSVPFFFFLVLPDEVLEGDFSTCIP